MKAIALLLASACLINGLAAYSINFPLEDEKPEVDESESSFDIDDHLNIFFPDDEAAENLIVPFPTDDPTEETTTTWAPTTTWEPTTTTTPEEPTTSTTRRPTTTWRPPRPTTTTPKPAPGRKNPQIYNNAVRSLGPFAGRLVNIVLNKQGAQKTIQENRIAYNLNSRRNNNTFYSEEMEN